MGSGSEGVRFIPDFTGDTNQNEANLTQFIRSVYALANTANLSQQTTIAVILQNVTGFAHELLQQFITISGEIRG